MESSTSMYISYLQWTCCMVCAFLFGIHVLMCVFLFVLCTSLYMCDVYLFVHLVNWLLITVLVTYYGCINLMSFRSSFPTYIAPAFVVHFHHSHSTRRSWLVEGSACCSAVMQKWQRSWCTFDCSQ